MDAASKKQYIEFAIKKEKYAIDIQDIHEIIKWQDITPLPNSKTYVKGVINLRGKVIPVVSLRNRLGFIEETNTKSTRIIVIKLTGELVGVIVDQVTYVTTISEIYPFQHSLRDQDNSFMTGYAKTENGLLCILQVERVFQ